MSSSEGEANMAAAAGSPPGEGEEAERRPEVETTSKVGNYEMGKLLGEGAFSKVKLGTHLTTKLLFAIKVVDKDGINNIKDLERVMREMHVLKNIRHPNIISLHDVIERGSKIYLVLDFAQGGELNEYIIAKGAVPEREARTWFAQIMSGVDFCHRQHVSHRDLKPENVLMVEQGSTVVCKIADFGLSNDMVAGEMLKTVCGTPAFAAPEVTLGQKYDGAAVDVWSLGAILFTMVAGTIPFDSGSQPELFRKIQHGVYSVPVHCSPELADMIRRFLEVQPLKRATIAQAWQHPWLSSLNNRFLELDDGLDDEQLEQDLKDATLEGAAEAPGEGVAKKFESRVAETEQTLELLPHHHLPASYLDAIPRDQDNVAFFKVTVLTPSEDLPPGGAAEGGATQSTNYTLFALPKSEKGVVPSGKVETTGRPRIQGFTDAIGGSKPTNPGSPIGGVAARSAAMKIPSRIGSGGVSSGTTPAGGGGVSGTITSGTICGSSPPNSGASGSGSLPSSSGGLGAMRVRRRSIETPGGVGVRPLLLTKPAAGAAATSAAPGTAVGGGVKPSTSDTNLATVVSKDPKVVLRDLQKLFGDYKVLLRSVNASSVKGEKNRVRFQVWIHRITAVNDTAVEGDLFMVGTSRMSGDQVTCRDICRRLLLKI